VKGESPRKTPAFRKRVFILGVVCLLLVMVVTSVFGKKGVMDIRRARLRLADLDLEIQRLSAEKLRLEAEIHELEKNPKAVEKEARGDMWLIKPGEKVIVVPKDPRK
jgi:cell division protein FtsB